MLTARFEYAPQIVERFPSAVGGAIHATGLTSGASPAALVEAFEAQQAEVLARIGSMPLSELPTLAAWRHRPARWSHSQFSAPTPH